MLPSPIIKITRNRCLLGTRRFQTSFKGRRKRATSTARLKDASDTVQGTGTWLGQWFVRLGVHISRVGVQRRKRYKDPAIPMPTEMKARIAMGPR